MGAWDISVFDDDTACDALEELRESSDIMADMKEYFDRAVRSEYLEYDDGCYALAAAAVIDSVLNDTVYSCDDEEHREWIKSLKELDFSGLRFMAAKAVGAVISDNSELRELWEENEELYGQWREEKLAIQKRLS